MNAVRTILKVYDDKTTKLDTHRNKNQHRKENKSLVKAPVCKEVDF